MKALALAAMFVFSSSAAAHQEQVYKPGPGIKSPEIVKEVKPRYTAAAMRNRIQGEVELEAVVGVDGKPASIKVITSLDTVHGLDKEAIDAFSQWVFKPGMREGKPVPVQVKVALKFTLREENLFDARHPDVVPPVLTFEKKPEYTPEAMRAKVEGVVELEGIVQAGGGVADIRVIKGIDPGLDQKAVAAFKAYVYKPATLKGRPVLYRLRVQISFSLRN